MNTFNPYQLTVPGLQSEKRYVVPDIHGCSKTFSDSGQKGAENHFKTFLGSTHKFKNIVFDEKKQ